MGKRDPRVDAYIEASADFSKPILKQLRATVHDACPECEETMKWRFPHFEYKGMLCGMAAFKQHATFGFWKGSLVMPEAEGGEAAKDGMGHFGKMATLADLPPKKVLTGYIKKAMALNDEGVKVERKPKAAPKPVKVPADLSAALGRSKKAKAAFDAFSPSHKREYVEWITEAKSDDTRARRLKQAVEWIAEGKSRNWKYER
jgi:uncharacterized protein YdeI (YjbR/CyaY-like superfamily)